MNQTNLLYKTHFYILLQSRFRSFMWLLSLQKLCMHLSCLMHGKCLRIMILNDHTFSSFIHETIFNLLSCLMIFIAIIKVSVCAFSFVRPYWIAPPLHHPKNFLLLNIQPTVCWCVQRNLHSSDMARSANSLVHNSIIYIKQVSFTSNLVDCVFIIWPFNKYQPTFLKLDCFSLYFHF